MLELDPRTHYPRQPQIPSTFPNTAPNTPPMTTQPASLDITPTLTLVEADTKQPIEKDLELGKPDIIETEKTTESQGEPQQSRLRKAFIIAILCSAQIFDIFSSVEAVIALPEVREH